MYKRAPIRRRDNAIDWVVRRPEGHVVSSKIHFATRLHRDPDSWTNPRTPQKPKDGWTELAMPERERYDYRFVNVWVARSAIDPTGQVWQSPLVVCLPRDGGKREWAFERQGVIHLFISLFILFKCFKALVPIHTTHHHHHHHVYVRADHVYV